WFVAGVIVRVRLLSLPPNTIALVGIRAELVEATERMSSLADVSTSAMVNGTGPMTLSSSLVWARIEEINGKSFTGLTETRNEDAAVAPSGSSTVMVTRLVPN